MKWDFPDLRITERVTSVENYISNLSIILEKKLKNSLGATFCGMPGTLIEANYKSA